jgi:hypothetical protein
LTAHERELYVRYAKLRVRDLFSVHAPPSSGQTFARENKKCWSIGLSVYPVTEPEFRAMWGVERRLPGQQFVDAAEAIKLRIELVRWFSLAEPSKL